MPRADDVPLVLRHAVPTADLRQSQLNGSPKSNLIMSSISIQLHTSFSQTPYTNVWQGYESENQMTAWQPHGSCRSCGSNDTKMFEEVTWRPHLLMPTMYHQLCNQNHNKQPPKHVAIVKIKPGIRIQSSKVGSSFRSCQWYISWAIARHVGTPARLIIRHLLSQYSLHWGGAVCL